MTNRSANHLQLVTGAEFAGNSVSELPDAERHRPALPAAPGSLHERARLGEVLRSDLRVDVRDRDLASTVADLQRAVAKGVRLSPGVSIAYSGQFEYLQRAESRLMLVIPATLAIIFLLLRGVGKAAALAARLAHEQEAAVPPPPEPVVDPVKVGLG